MSELSSIRVSTAVEVTMAEQSAVPRTVGSVTKVSRTVSPAARSSGKSEIQSPSWR